MLQPVRAVRLLARGGAERPHRRGQGQRGAVGRGDHPADRGLPAGQPEVAVVHIGSAAVEQDRQHEGHGQRGSGGDRAAHPARGDGQVEDGGHDQQLADLVHGGRQAEDHPGHGGQPDGHRRPPEQQAQAGHDHRLEPDVRHDRLLDLDLVGVQQHRRHRHGGQPAAGPAAHQQHVQGHRDGQAQQVLGQRDEAHAAEDQDGPEHQRVPERVSPGRRPVQVLQRVHVDQGGLVGDLRRDPQRQPGGQQHRQQPVPGQQPAARVPHDWPAAPGVPPWSPAAAFRVARCGPVMPVTHAVTLPGAPSAAPGRNGRPAGAG